MNKLFKSADFQRIREEDYMKMVVSKFIESPISFESKNTKPMAIAIARGYHLLVKYLIEKGYKLAPFDFDNDGLNCLASAIKNIRISVLYKLLAKIGPYLARFDVQRKLIAEAVKYLDIETFQEFIKVHNIYIIYIHRCTKKGKGLA